MQIRIPKFGFKNYIRRTLAAEISSFSRYFEKTIQYDRHLSDDGALLSMIDCPNVESTGDINSTHHSTLAENILYLLNGNLNFEEDIEALLIKLRNLCTRTTRVALILYSPYLRWLFLLANTLGFRSAGIPTTFLTTNSLLSLAKLTNFEIVRTRQVVYFPSQLLGLGSSINKLLALVPLISRASIAQIVILRPTAFPQSEPSLSIVIPARNEKGNIESLLTRIPKFGTAKLEIIFVEGHSEDQTWQEINRVVEKYQHKIKLIALKQLGRGKADAVRTGFAKASGELLTILDADLSMPPELLPRFYQAYCKGYGDFINGNRLLYPSENNAMRFLNRLGNVFFAKALSYVLDTPLGDSLCGTKMISRSDYFRISRWRRDNAIEDPFGDFELLFPAAALGLGIVDIPIKYRARTYGTTNIRRFYHGLMLLKMTILGFLSIKLIKTNGVSNKNNETD